MKRLIKVCTLLSLITLLTVPVYASHAEDLEINLLKSAFDISDNGLASISTHLSAFNVVQVRMAAYVQQYREGSLTTIKSWSSAYDGTSDSLNQIWLVSRG